MGLFGFATLLVISRPYAALKSKSISIQHLRNQLYPLFVSSKQEGQASNSNMSIGTWETRKKDALEKCILPLTENSHKGASGRIAVIGGSERYTGAPYYAAIAALRTGVDLSTVFCAEEAAIPIKSYSPEIMVQGVYSANTIHCQDGQVKAMVESLKEGIERIHCLVIGPGLGRSPPVMDAVQQLISVAIAKRIYLVLDADALFLLSHYKDILRGYKHVVLTPNAIEYQRMKEAGVLENTLDAIIVQKGRHDIISKGGEEVTRCCEQGGLKRPGGIGDVLAGTTAALVSWHALQGGDLALSCWTACCIVKRATSKAYRKKLRSMSAHDVIDEIGSVFEEMTA